ncbi:hypothetical protein HB791_07315 [Listeria welshimeri]|nr:hypothetical protein [Listeria welshimeri]MBC1346964.1 hypothetical protein [Listeria welshimeri]MBC1462176.1 hypothetical protein [Listeria welshimeri]MBC6174983.1 hypothetical protein [Listeria welshimeri]MBC6177068.1 hypothetical protein [Listeria welshimeri]
MNDTVKKQLAQHITSRLLWELSPYITAFILVPCICISMIFFTEQLEHLVNSPILFGLTILGPPLSCCLISWMINVKWLWKDRKEIQQFAETAYDEKLVKLYTIASIFYVCVLTIPFAIGLRWCMWRVVKDKVKPNTMSAFLNEKYLNEWGLK